jgi:hypothetical protein
MSAGFNAKSMEELTARVRELERALQEAQMAREAAEYRAQKQLAEVTFLQNSKSALQAEMQALRGDRREGGSRGDGREGGRELVEGVSAQQQSADEEEDTCMSCHVEGARGSTAERRCRRCRICRICRRCRAVRSAGGEEVAGRRREN